MNKQKRTLYILLLSLILFAGGITVTAADSSLSGVLTNWLNDKTDESIEEIDKAIQEEQAKQTERLKEALAEQIAEVEKELDEFIQAEKEKQVTNLREYADEKLNQLPELEPADKTALENELEQIYQVAITEMEKVTIETKVEEGEE